MASQVSTPNAGNPTPPPERLAEELTAVLSIDDEVQRAHELVDLAPRLRGPLMDRAISAMASLRNDRLRLTTIIEMAPLFKQSQALMVYSMIKRIGALDLRIEGFGRIYAYVPEATRSEILDQIRTHSGSADVRLKAWIGMPEFLTPELKEEAISSALNLGNEEERSTALIALAPHLTDVWKLKALKSARTIFHSETRVRTLTALLPVLPRKQQPDVLDETLSLARGLDDPESRARALMALHPHIPPQLRPEVYQEIVGSARNIIHLHSRIMVLLDVAETMSPDDVDPVGFVRVTLLEPIREIQDEKERADALILLAEFGPSQLHNEILAVAARITDFTVKSRAIIKLENIKQLVATSAPDPAATSPESQSGDVNSGDGSAIAESGPVSVAGDVSAIVTEVAPVAAAVPTANLASPGAENVETPAPTLAAGANLEGEQSAEISPAPKKARTKATKAKPPKASLPTPELEPDPPGESVGIKAYLHSDRWTLDDQLNYSLYAEAIAEFICHEDTQPPLAIGILAPWGQGKTTLMKLVQNELEKKVQTSVAGPEGVVAPPITTRVTFEDLRKWLQDPVNFKPKVEKLSYPTVWFNAWKYQNSEQVWSGMAYSILNQLVAQLSSQYEREKFWLALQAERVDFNAIRKDIHRTVFERIAPWLIIWTIVGFVGLILLLFGVLGNSPRIGGFGGMSLAVGVMVPVLQWLRARTKIDSKPLEGKFAQYVRQPTYEGKLGFFHEIETDVQRVFKLLVAEGKPVVVFIDDLDRCNPGTVAQVIEAMNLFLSADFPDCYFVVGMDAQVVAASMEVAYENLDKKLKSVTRSYGSLGWYFMDKFIQLSFNIPNMTPDQRSAYLDNLFGQERKRGEELPEQVLDEVQKNFTEKVQNAELKPEELHNQAAELAKLRRQRPKEWRILTHTLLQTGAKQLSDNSPVLQKYLQRYEPYLGVSPRGIKRFANLYRFYNLSQLSRRSQGLQSCSPSALARWMVIMLRWPQVVRWIQWEGEARLSASTGAINKAADLEEALGKTATHQAWIKHLETIDNQMEWLRDKQLWEFLKAPSRADEKLSLAVQTGVW